MFVKFWSVCVWDLRWRRPLFVSENDLLNELLVVVTRHSRVEREDVWSWTHSPDGRYSVKSAYSSLLKGVPVVGALEGDILQAVSRIWKSWAPKWLFSLGSFYLIGFLLGLTW